MAAPIKHTCPDIDKYIKSINQTTIRERDLIYFTEDDLRDTCISLNRELENCIDYLEEMRSANGALRDWGEELDKEVNDAANTIYDLEQEIEALKSCIAETAPK